MSRADVRLLSGRVAMGEASAVSGAKACLLSGRGTWCVDELNLWALRSGSGVKTNPGHASLSAWSWRARADASGPVRPAQLVWFQPDHILASERKRWSLLDSDSTWLKLVHVVITSDGFTYAFLVLRWCAYDLLSLLLSPSQSSHHIHIDKSSQNLTVQWKNRFVRSLSLTCNTTHACNISGTRHGILVLAILLIPSVLLAIGILLVLAMLLAHAI